MNPGTWHRWLRSIAIASGISPLFSMGVLAQITPDQTLGAEPSMVRMGEAMVDRIEGGAIRGSNLFHSFQDFNIAEGQRIYFASPTGINHIFSRVTGQRASNLLGTLGVQGEGNLFFFNPNGIIFGQNARLDLKGSFFASTANGVQFGNQGFFSTTDGIAPPLLTINPSAFVFNQRPPGIIINKSIAPIQSRIQGLAVNDGQGLTLLGGNVQIDGGDEAGGLYALGGRIEIGAVAGSGKIDWNPNGSLGFPADMARGDVTLTRQARVRVSRDGQGDIGITARNINLQAGSLLLAGIASDLGAIGQQAGNITLNATGDISMTGTSAINNTMLGKGNAGNIDITGRSLSLFDNSLILGLTFGQGNAGSISLNISDRISLGKDTFLGTGVESKEAIGNSGNIKITTNSLYLTDNAAVFADTFGKGSAGDIIINARDAVSLDDSVILANVASTATGNGGKIQITAKSLSLTTGSQLTSSTRGKGDAGGVKIAVEQAVVLDGTTRDGESPSEIFSSVNSRNAVGNSNNIEITAGSLTLTNGARLRASTQGQGNAGNILITVRDNLLFDGKSRNGRFTTAAITGVGGTGIGNGGDIRISGNSLVISNEAELNATANGKGLAGNIIIDSRSVILNRGFLTAEAEQIGGANIRLQNLDLLLLKNGSSISAQAFNNAIGGNITINANSGVIVASPNQDSDIIANAEKGRGGNITITAQSILGIEQRRSIPNNQTNDIDASSQFNQSGTITINRLGLDPVQGLAELPSEPRSPQPLAGCQSGGTKGGRLIATGTGGLPSHPSDPLSGLNSLDDLPLPAQWQNDPTLSPLISKSPTIEEAQTWRINAQGQVQLVAGESVKRPCG